MPEQASRQPDSPLIGAVSTLEQLIGEAAMSDLPRLAGEMERLRAMAWARLTTPQPTEKATERPELQWLSVPEVAARLNLAKSYGELGIGEPLARLLRLLAKMHHPAGPKRKA